VKVYSLTRRLIFTVLALELVLALSTTGAALLYERHQHLRSFDIMLRGRADSLLGAVQDAEDEADNVLIDPKAIDLEGQDLWQVSEPSGRVLGHSEQWDAAREGDFGGSDKGRDFILQGRRYRGLVIHGVRQIDQDDKSPGIARPVIIYYAASLRPVTSALKDAARFLLLSNSLVLLLTGGALLLLLRRGLAPLEELSRAAAAIAPERWQFQAPQSASEVKELAVLAVALDSAMARLEQSFRQQQAFVHDAAHELKTAVTIIKSSLQVLTSRPRTANEYADGLETCLTDCARMEELVHRMLMLARFEQGGPGAIGQPNVTDLSARLREAVGQMEHFAQLERVSLRLEASAPAFVGLSAEACDTLITNLVMNALQHTGAEGIVRVSLNGDDGAGILQIEDTGTGIGSEELRHIFERFYRGDPSRSRRTGGVGLGLAIAKAITDSYGGVIEIHSVSGLGTRVTVKLPLLPAESAGNDATAASRVGSEPKVHSMES
jgi:signal transduction histidine kinase